MKHLGNKVWQEIKKSTFVQINDKGRPYISNKKYIYAPEINEDVICLYEEDQQFRVKNVNIEKNHVDVFTDSGFRTFPLDSVLTLKSVKNITSELGMKLKLKSMNDTSSLPTGEYYFIKRKVSGKGGRNQSGIFLVDHKGNKVDGQKFNNIGSAKSCYQVNKLTTKNLDDDFLSDQTIVKVWKIIVKKGL